MSEISKKNGSDITKAESDKKDKNNILKEDYSDLYEIPLIDSSVEKYKKKKKVKKKISAIVLGIIVLIYIGGVIYHSLFFSRNTYVNGIDVSNKSLESAKEIIRKDMLKYSLKIDFTESERTISPKDGIFEVNTAETIKEIKKKDNAFLWVVNVWEKNDIHTDYQTKCDETKLAELVKSYEELDKNNMKKPVNAKVSMEGGEAKIVKEYNGTMLDTDKTIEAIYSAISNMDKEVSLMDKECYEKADILSDDEALQKQYEAAETYLSINAVYDFKGYEVPIPKENLAEMAYIDDNGKIQISKTNVEVFTKKFAEQYSTSDTERKFKTHDGKMILVYGGYYGWVLDAETEKEELYDALVKGKDFTKQFACEREGYAYCDLNDIGENYVEIDLTNQHVYVYENGKKVFDTPCVSGNENLGRGTPGGLYGLTYKQENAILRGPGYATPVAYWMPFNGGIGMHDATWKTKFGEDYYIYDGSHGCINLPLEAAATIYPYVETGSPVVCYWRNEVTFIDE